MNTPFKLLDPLPIVNLGYHWQLSSVNGDFNSDGMAVIGVFATHGLFMWSLPLGAVEVAQPQPHCR